ncbi:MAG TPA: polysaccharide biosynthesis/export family protein [Phycisphaerae bacterium]|nr:polysaccharide biosynthesis/export family protein [Phycisphaerae bacterium]
MPRTGTAMLALAACGLGLAMAGCGGGPTKEERAQLKYFPKAYQQTVSTDRFPVNPPDVLTIHAALAPEVNGVSQQIAPDGTINLDLLNRVYVAGMSPAEVESLLAQKLETYYKDVKVQVDVTYKSQQYYIFGEADKPGPRPYTGRDTLIAALADAQPTRLAWPERIYVIKASPDPDKRHVTVINLKDITQRGDSTANVLLQQDDIVYIPLNPLAAIGVAMQNLLFPIEPIVTAAGSARSLTYGF